MNELNSRSQVEPKACFERKPSRLNRIEKPSTLRNALFNCRKWSLRSLEPHAASFEQPNGKVQSTDRFNNKRNQKCESKNRVIPLTIEFSTTEKPLREYSKATGRWKPRCHFVHSYE